MEGFFEEEKTLVDEIHDIEKNTLAGKLHEMRMRKKYGDVDNIDYAAVSNFDVEDPKLIEHMDNARKQLKAFTIAQSQPPSAEEVAALRAEIKQQIADLVRMSNECQTELVTAIDDANLHASNVRKIADGIQPWGYPDIRDKSICLRALGDKMSELSLNMESVLLGLKKSYSATLATARNYENFVAERAAAAAQ
jgi:hypothetical protein